MGRAKVGASLLGAVVGVLLGLALLGAAVAAASSRPGGPNVVAWGDGYWGTLGDGRSGSGANSAQPVGVQLSDATSLSAGATHALAVRSDGTVYSWGNDENGQLGDGCAIGTSGCSSRATPAQVASLSRVVSVAAGSDHSLALRTDGTVWAWGGNSHGQLGNGCTVGSSCSDSSTPAQVPNLSGVVAIAAGLYDSVALRADGTVWTWGWNSYGQLGNGCTADTNCSDSSTPVEVTTSVGGPALTGVTAIAAGQNHDLAVTSDGTVYAWGADGSGQLGDACVEGSSCEDRGYAALVYYLPDVTAVAAGDSDSLALGADGSVWSWGYNSYGQLGNGSTSDGTYATQVAGLENIKSIAAADNTGYALAGDGSVWAWGDGLRGQLGNDTYYDSSVPLPASLGGLGGALFSGPTAEFALITRPTALSSGSALTFPVAQVGSTGHSQTVSVSNAGGGNLSFYGTSIVGSDADSFKISGDSCSYTTIAAGNTCSISVRYDPATDGQASAQLRLTSNDPSSPLLVGLSGSAVGAAGSGPVPGATPNPLFATGNNTSGQLGTGTISSASSPVQSGTGSYVAAASGFGFSLGLRQDGTVWGWGANDSGQLGDGSTVERNSAVQVPVLNNVTAVAAGDDHSLALRSDGTVWAWGDEADGALGDGCASCTGAVTSPEQVQGLDHVVAVAAGVNDSLALRSDGTVWAWGDNAHGELGNGCVLGSTCRDSSTPTQVTGLSGIVAVAAGAYHDLALGSDGTVYAWGANGSGQLGNGCTEGSNCNDTSTPAAVSGVSGAIAIAAGLAHSMALTSGGTIRTWGDNTYGQLGNSSTTSSSTPVQPTLTHIVSIGSGLNYGLAIDPSGHVWAWGQNDDGELGNGNTTDEPAPVAMSSGRRGGEQLAQSSTARQTLFIGQPQLTVTSANPVIFPSETPGTPSPSQSVTVQNAGFVPLQIGQAVIVGSDGDEFTFAGDGCSNTSVQPTKSCAISIRYDPKINAKAVATLRIPSNGPGSPYLVTLDPPAKTSASAPAVACVQRRAVPGLLRLRCRVPRSLSHGKHRLTIRLIRAGRTVATATRRVAGARTITVTLELPRGLRAGGYTIAISTRKLRSTIEGSISLPRIASLRR